MTEIEKITLEKFNQGKICPIEINCIVGSAEVFDSNDSNPAEPTDTKKD